jgi:hypothetical protein
MAWCDFVTDNPNGFGVIHCSETKITSKSTGPQESTNSRRVPSGGGFQRLSRKNLSASAPRTCMGNL